MILITGANGNLGSATIDFLLKENPSADVAGLVRSEEKGSTVKEKGAEIRIGDYQNYSSVQSAVQDVDTLLLVSSSTLQNRVQQHKNVVNAAKEAGVQQLFYTSIVQADKKLSPLAPDHGDTEEIIKASGIPYTIFRNTFYMEFLPMYWGEAVETGEWNFPGNDQELNFALRSEMAEALAGALSNPTAHKNKTYEITSAKAYTLTEIAKILSNATGREITYNDLSVKEFRKRLQQANVPDDIVNLNVAVAETFVNGGLSYTDDALESLLGRQPTDTKDFIQQTTD